MKISPDLISSAILPLGFISPSSNNTDEFFSCQPLPLVSLAATLHDLNLLLRHPIELVHQRINRRIRRLDLPLKQRLLMLQFGVLQFLIEVEHLRDERDHVIMAGSVRRIGKLMVWMGADGDVIVVKKMEIEFMERVIFFSVP